MNALACTNSFDEQVWNFLQNMKWRSTRHALCDSITLWRDFLQHELILLFRQNQCDKIFRDVICGSLGNPLQGSLFIAVSRLCLQEWSGVESL